MPGPVFVKIGKMPSLRIEDGAASRLGHPCPRSGPWGALRVGIASVTSGQRQAFLTAEYALVHVLDGSGTYLDHDHRMTFRAGDVFQRRPDQPHEVVYDGPHRIAFVATPAACLELLRLAAATVTDAPVFTVGRQPGLVQRLVRERERLRGAAEDDLFTRLVALQELQAAYHAAARRAEIRDFRAAASDLLARNQSPGAVARALGLAERTFRHRFRREFACSPTAYRIRRRIDRAMDLLLRDDRPLAEVAEELGYSDVFAFAAQFKQVVGTSPGTFRVGG